MSSLKLVTNESWWAGRVSLGVRADRLSGSERRKTRACQRSIVLATAGAALAGAAAARAACARLILLEKVVTAALVRVSTGLAASGIGLFVRLTAAGRYSRVACCSRLCYGLQSFLLRMWLCCSSSPVFARTGLHL
jgi:hypothetical protein